MATTSKRKFDYDAKNIKNFGRQIVQFDVPDLTILQKNSYKKFLQREVEPTKRKNYGLEAVLRESFPLFSADHQSRIDYLYYELEDPTFTEEECRRLKQTYGYPFKVRLRLVPAEEGEISEDFVYLGTLPAMIGGGEFIINGAERVVVNQLHRSPGIDFVKSVDETDNSISYHSRIVPERGSWVELYIASKVRKDPNRIEVQIDQGAKFCVMDLIRAMDSQYSSDEAILRLFFETRKVSLRSGRSANKIAGKVSVKTLCYPKGTDRDGEEIVKAGYEIDVEAASAIATCGIKEVEIFDAPSSKDLILPTFRKSETHSTDEALLKFYLRLRSGSPAQIDKARLFLKEKFFDPSRYRLGEVGRVRINRKFNPEYQEPEDGVPLEEQVLQVSDLINAVKYLNKLWSAENADKSDRSDNAILPDDIDHLGNRRVRTIEELACEDLRKGFMKLRRSTEEKLRGDAKLRSVINNRNISNAIDSFFGRGELSQVVDQTNPLSMLTHERRLSALGPGGLNRKRAGFEVRDVHASHYGRICPIETPEGANIGLISSLSIYSRVDRLGFLETPYRKVEDGKVTKEIEWLRADSEQNVYVVPADVTIKPNSDPNDEKYIGTIQPDPASGQVIARNNGEYVSIPVNEVQYIDVSPNQMLGVSAGLIPFLEHDDANRALMGANMQRQAVPLLISEAPLVGTGLEEAAAHNSSLLVKAENSGEVTYVDAAKIVISYKDKSGTPQEETHLMRKFVGLNERTCQNQKPLVKPGDHVKAGDVIADGACTDHGVLALGRNVLVAFMVWDGFNFEDAVIISEELVQNDTYTSIHIEEYDGEVRETKAGGRGEFTREIPNVSEKALRNLDEKGVVQIGTYVKPGDILIGRVKPKNKSELAPEEKLLHAIFGRAGEDVKNDSVVVPPGVEGVVIGVHRYKKQAGMDENELREFKKEQVRLEEEGNSSIADAFTAMVLELEETCGHRLIDSDGSKADLCHDRKITDIVQSARNFNFDEVCKANDIADSKLTKEMRKIYDKHKESVRQAVRQRDRSLNTYLCGEQLHQAVLEMVKVYVATKRVISVGDKMAGRHGNKGVIAKILPKEDMPYMEDGTPIQIMLNPLGVPSRMNVGQILETHLGWAASRLGYHAQTPVFDGATEAQINDELAKAGLPRHGKVQLYDGRTGEPFDQETTVGYIYMLKLHHLVDDKIHARNSGPYALVTQQPLGGKARSGGQRFGEMEVWALEAYGAAYTLQEILTVKSDDIEGRKKIFASMVNGENTLEAGTPASFDVLLNEVKGLALDMDLIPDAHRVFLNPDGYGG
ncbi:MAG: DNA-directed RNA polymerase subunit beta [Thermoguttaceae bacterium]|nr:DNA-directed RNA polymerase subunit beta [Thermoguttaceae bacterium]